MSIINFLSDYAMHRYFTVLPTIYLSQLTTQFQPFWHSLPSTITLLLLCAFMVHTMYVCPRVRGHVLSNNGGSMTTEHILSSHTLPPRQGETLHWQSAPLSPIMGFAAQKYTTFALHLHRTFRWSQGDSLNQKTGLVSLTGW